MRTTDVDILLVPGLGGSGPDHWQSRWERQLTSARRVEQDDWDRPLKVDWTARLVDAVASATKPIVLVAHSLGVPLVVHTAPKLTVDIVLGAFLVASPSEMALAEIADVDPDFRPYPRDPLPFPSLLVASRNDRYCSYDDAGELALAWGSELLDAGDSGHINSDSGHGPWPEGAMQFGWFLKQLGRQTKG